MINIGIIGTGSIADDKHAPAAKLSKNATLHSVFSRSADRAAWFAAKHSDTGKAVAPFTDFNCFLQDDLLDAVVIASEDRLHASQIVACAKAGKHVLVEKPFVTSLIEGYEAIDAFRNSNLKLCIGFHHRHHEGHKLLKAAIERNTFGELRHMRFLYTFKAASGSNWRANHQLGKWWSLAATGSHCIDMVTFLADQPLSDIDFSTTCAATGVISDGGHDETAILSLRFRNQLTVDIVSSVLFNAPSRIEVYGEADYALCDNTLGRSGAGTILLGKTGVLQFEPKDPYLLQMEAFVQSIKRDQYLLPDGAVGLENTIQLLRALE